MPGADILVLVGPNIPMMQLKMLGLLASFPWSHCLEPMDGVPVVHTR
jgi:hypothetical protein